jgi:hypothetical protein
MRYSFWWRSITPEPAHDEESWPLLSIVRKKKLIRMVDKITRWASFFGHAAATLTGGAEDKVTLNPMRFL